MRAVAVAALALAAACGDGAAPAAERPRGAIEPRPVGAGAGAGQPAALVGPTAAAATARRPALAASPRLDLAANHVRFHLHDRGLVIPVGGEGLRLYDLEYARPWGAATGGGRKLRARTATLTAPWPGGAGELAIRARGTPRIKVAIDGKAIGAVAIGDAWTTGAVALPELRAGDHRITLTPEKKGALVASVELVPEAAAASCAAGAALPDTALAGGMLGGWRRMTIVVEVPAAAYLVVAPSGGGGASITARVEGGAEAPLWTGTAAGAEQVIDLAPLAGKLVELAFVGECTARWKGAAIAVAGRDLPAAPAPVKNVVLVVVDTLRGDRVPVIEPATRVKMPRLAAVTAERGIAFRRHQSMAPSSPPSHASIHTGQIPRVHGAAGDDPPVRPDAPVLARVLGEAGFFTGYVGNNDFAMGRIKKVARWRAAHTPVFEGKGIECEAVFEGALALVKRARAANERYFITALPIQPHLPYRYHEGITDKYFKGPWGPPVGKRVTERVLARMRGGASAAKWDQFRALYDGEVENLDRCLAILFDGLKALGAADDTAIVITSDHGEGMGERGGRVGHAYSLNRELIHVPLVVIGSGLPPASVDAITSAADVAPTVLDLLGLPPEPRMQGASLLPLARAGGAGPARVVASEYGRAYAITGGRWRYLVGYDGKGRLYDVIDDPEETRDVAAAAPLALRYLRGAAGLYLEHRVAWRARTWGTLADLAPTAPVAKGEP